MFADLMASCDLLSPTVIYRVQVFKGRNVVPYSFYDVNRSLTEHQQMLKENVTQQWIAILELQIAKFQYQAAVFLNIIQVMSLKKFIKITLSFMLVKQLDDSVHRLPRHSSNLWITGWVDDRTCSTHCIHLHTSEFQRKKSEQMPIMCPRTSFENRFYS